MYANDLLAGRRIVVTGGGSDDEGRAARERIEAQNAADTAARTPR